MREASPRWEIGTLSVGDNVIISISMVKTTREMSKGVPPYIWKNISVEPVLYSKRKIVCLAVGWQLSREF